MCIALAALGAVVASWIPGLDPVTAAIAVGFIAGNLPWWSAKLTPGAKYAGKQGMSVAIVLLGFGLDLGALAALDRTALPLLGVMVATAVMGGFVLGPLLGLTRTLGGLVGIGTAICGSSAIAATSALLEDGEEEAPIAIGVVNLLGTTGMVLLPLLATVLALAPADAAFMIGSTLHAVGHVAGAGFTLSPEIGELATAVKMGRVAMLAPLLLVLGRGRTAGGLPVPGYLIGFGVGSLLVTFVGLPAPLAGALKLAATATLTVAMAGLGAGVDLRQLANDGARALGLGILLFALQLTLVLAVLLSF